MTDLRRGRVARIRERRRRAEDEPGIPVDRERADGDERLDEVRGEPDEERRGDEGVSVQTGHHELRGERDEDREQGQTAKGTGGDERFDEQVVRVRVVKVRAEDAHELEVPVRRGGRLEVARAPTQHGPVEERLPGLAVQEDPVAHGLRSGERSQRARADRCREEQQAREDREREDAAHEDTRAREPAQTHQHHERGKARPDH